MLTAPCMPSVRPRSCMMIGVGFSSFLFRMYYRPGDRMLFVQKGRSSVLPQTHAGRAGVPRVPAAQETVPRAARGGTPGRALLQARFAGTVMASLSDEEKLALQVGGLSPAALRAAQARLSDTTFVLGPLISNNLTVYDVHAFHAGEAWRHKHLQSDGVRPTATCRTQRPHMRLH